MEDHCRALPDLNSLFGALWGIDTKKPDGSIRVSDVPRFSFFVELRPISPFLPFAYILGRLGPLLFRGMPSRASPKHTRPWTTVSNLLSVVKANYNPCRQHFGDALSHNNGNSVFYTVVVPSNEWILQRVASYKDRARSWRMRLADENAWKRITLDGRKRLGILHDHCPGRHAGRQ